MNSSIRTYSLGKSTPADVEEYLKKSKKLILPVGNLIQTNPHLPLRATTILAQKLARDVSYTLKIMCSPPLEFDGEERDNSESIADREDVFAGYFTENLNSFREMGFDTIYCITFMESGYLTLLEDCCINRQCANILTGYRGVDFQSITDNQKEWNRGGEIEISLLMYTSPKLVNFTDIEESQQDLNSVGPAGAEKGKEIYGRMLKSLVGKIRKND